MGAFIYTHAAKGGAQAMGRESGHIVTGSIADLVAIDSTAPELFALNEDQLLDGLVFVANDNVVTDVWSAGRHQVSGGRHKHRDTIVAGYCTAMRTLMAAL